MCQLIVILDDTSSTPGAYRAGEVVCIVEDDHVFSPLELAHPRWRVVKVPGLSAVAMGSLGLQNLTTQYTLRRAQRVSPESAVLMYLRSSSGVLTLSPREAFELIGAMEPHNAY